jgi:hypothetical protein
MTKTLFQLLLLIPGLCTLSAFNAGTPKSNETIAIIEKANTYWQQQKPDPGNARANLKQMKQAQNEYLLPVF